jgi:hypothetical protein
MAIFILFFETEKTEIIPGSRLLILFVSMYHYDTSLHVDNFIPFLKSNAY